MRQKGINYAKYGYYFSIPFVLIFLLFSLYPLIYTIIIGFTDLRGIGRTAFSFLEDPFQNFKLILANPSFRKSLSNTFLIWIMNFIPQILLALLLTAWFTNNSLKVRGQGAFKVLFYMPNIITAATIAILFNSLFGYPKGPVNDLLMMLGLSDSPIYFLVQKWTARGIVGFIQFWMWYGNTMIILIAGVLGINPTLFEAAEIDGASAPQIFFRITLPNLRTILLYTLVTSLIGGMQMFDIPRLFLLGGPDNATLTTSVFIYNQAFSGSYLYNRASAASMIMFILIMILSGILFLIMRDKDAARRRKEKKAMMRSMKTIREVEV
ncbi:carbohydrate ABC transporter permease [Parasphaerochaeta coccoides]|uniref:Carbohydrate ABC transporter membrane protein 1, CUT1 family n=1 Tax=Parasphaerochaeta coccoides (strain ATCC BAA-1237 / DSM 17374 / SPN1) TaxID=760011 RepID=F4GLH8_PARC1|nr:sugar ABC transporter permease [Parasphaerochaeta coccoides]AEC01948.1 carbohydrate ABC transporter membrane protein 1, CUT1 family [Parasphaerochaeta coccoides DSM 17374]